MTSIAFFFGVLLSILGGVLFGTSNPDHRSITALIPAFFGIALILLGIVARNEKARKHAMHFAALLGLVGLLGGVAMGIKALVGERAATVWGRKLRDGGPCAELFCSFASNHLLPSGGRGKRKKRPLNDAVQRFSRGTQRIHAAGYGRVFHQRRGVVRLAAGVDHQRSQAAPVFFDG